MEVDARGVVRRCAATGIRELPLLHIHVLHIRAQVLCIHALRIPVERVPAAGIRAVEHIRADIPAAGIRLVGIPGVVDIPALALTAGCSSPRLALHPHAAKEQKFATRVADTPQGPAKYRLRPSTSSPRYFQCPEIAPPSPR